MEKEKQESGNIRGKRKISNSERKTFSKRALKGKIVIEKEEKCPSCGHRKWIVNMNENSEKFNNKKCARCKKWLLK